MSTSRDYEPQDLGWGMHLVPLTKGHFAIIDSADAAEIGKYKWTAKENGNTVYAYRKASGGRANIWMHRVLAGADDPSIDVDHKNRDGLDNRRCNLRLATRSENLRNRISVKNTSGFKGVSWDKTRGLWLARIKLDGVARNLGRYATPEEAHAAYCEAAARLHGEFARTA